MASKKSIFSAPTKIPYADKSRLFDRGFPGPGSIFYLQSHTLDHARTFFPRPLGITFLNGFYVLNSNGGVSPYLYGAARFLLHPPPPNIYQLPAWPSPTLPFIPGSSRRHPRTPIHGERGARGGWSMSGFSRSRARYRLCQTGVDLICEAFVGTSRPRIIIKILHRGALSALPTPALPQPLFPAPRHRWQPPSVILHSIPSWINPLMAGSLIYALLQKNRC